MGGLLFFCSIHGFEPTYWGPRKFVICGESEDVRLPNVVEQQSLQQAQSERES